MDIIYLDVLQHNTTSSLVLVFHQLLGVFTFLVRRVLEELVKSWQSHIVPIEVQSLYDMIDTETIDTRRQNVTTMSVTCSLLTKTPLLYQNSHHLSNSTLTEKLYLSVIDILIIKFYTATEKKKPRCPP